MRSLGNFHRFRRARGQSLDLIRQLALAERPDLFLTDFEPLTALAAESLRVPCVSVDNQHRFCHPLGPEFPLYLRVYARLVGQFVRRWIRGPQECIVAVFHPCPESRYYRRVEAMVRSHIVRREPTRGDHVVLYGHGEVGRRMARVAATVGEQFVAYGFDGPAYDNIKYRPTSDEGFASDLASAKGVLAMAGQQLIGEARYFGKPMLVVPMPGQYEQDINAYYVRTQAIGDWCSIGQFTAEKIKAFLQQPAARGRPANGVDEVLRFLETGNGRIPAEASA